MDKLTGEGFATWLTEHYGPGPHPKGGTPQMVHSGGRQGAAMKAWAGKMKAQGKDPGAEWKKHMDGNSVINKGVKGKSTRELRGLARTLADTGDKHGPGSGTGEMLTHVNRELGKRGSKGITSLQNKRDRLDRGIKSTEQNLKSGVFGDEAGAAKQWVAKSKERLGELKRLTDGKRGGGSSSGMTDGDFSRLQSGDLRKGDMVTTGKGPSTMGTITGEGTIGKHEVWKIKNGLGQTTAVFKDQAYAAGIDGARPKGAGGRR